MSTVRASVWSWVARGRDRLPPLVPELAALLGAYSLLRLVFFVANRPAFGGVEAAKLLASFVHGLRFDVAAVCLCNAPVVALVVVTGFAQGRARALLAGAAAWLWPLVNIPPLLLNVLDVGYFPFSGRRSTLSLLAIGGDVRDQAGQLLLHFWPLTLLGLLLAAGTVWLGVGLRRRLAGAGPAVWWRQALGAAVATGLMVVGIRGGFQLKPLAAAHANVFVEPALASLILNTPFNVFHALKRKPLPALPFRADWPTVLEAVGRPPHRASFAGPRRDNVVILILESAGSEYSRLFRGEPVGPDSMPFLDTLAGRGLCFTNNFANGRRSIEAISSILAGLPSLMDEPFITSPYCNSRLDPLPARLRRHGWATAFFHGARNGTMMFDLFARLAGIERYFGMNEYPSRADFDGSWGIFDEPYLQYCAAELSKLPQPFLATVFTLSAHNPYPIPPQHRARFTGGPTRMHDSIRYADFALEQFFRAAAARPWFTNTLFILTADHSAGGGDPRFQTELGVYRVPLVVFHGGGAVRPRAPARVTHHADILPTVLDFLGLPLASANCFGRSVFDERFPGRALNQAAGTYWLVQPGRFLRYRLGGPPSLLSWEGGPWTASEEAGRAEVQRAMLRELQMFIQYFNQGLAENRLAPP